MRTASLIMALIVYTSSAQAEPTSLRYQSAKKMRLAGIVLTSVGAVLLITGIAVAAVSGADCPSDTDVFQGCSSGGDKLAAGLTLATVGMLAFVPGVILWPLGQVRMSHAEGAQLSLAPAPSGSLGAGVRLSW